MCIYITGSEHGVVNSNEKGRESLGGKSPKQGGHSEVRALLFKV